MYFSNEWKSPISKSDVMTLDHRLRAVTRQDHHAGSGYYTVHSLYFQEDMDVLPHTLRTDTEKKEIFRIRYYDSNTDLIKLEKKSESDGTSVIESCEITRDFVNAVLHRDFGCIVKDPLGRTGEELDPVIQEFYWNVAARRMFPTLAVDYCRRPYLYPHGDVRVTVDFNFRSSTDVSGFLDPCRMECIPTDGRYYIKIKWNSYLPEMIRSAVALINRNNHAYYLYEPVRMFV